MKDLQLMDVGYNLIERKLIGKGFEEVEDKISIIEFLRRLRGRQTINQRVAVTGLEEALLSGEEIARYIRNVLVDSTGMLRAHIIQFPINGEITLNREPKIRYKAKEISIAPIFGNRIRPKTVGFFHSPPNI